MLVRYTQKRGKPIFEQPKVSVNMRYIFLSFFLAPISLSCNKNNNAQSLYFRNKQDIQQVVDIYKKTSVTNYYQIQVNYNSLKPKVLIDYNLSNKEAQIFNYYDDTVNTKLFLQQTKIALSEIDNLISRLIRLKCIELYKNVYIVETPKGENQSYSISLMWNHKTKFKGFVFFDPLMLYPKKVTEFCKQIDSNVYYFETNTSMYE